MCWTHLHSKCVICPPAKVTGCFQAGYMVARGTHGDPQKQQGPTAWSLSPWGDDTGKRWLLVSNTHLGLGVSSEKPGTCCYLLTRSSADSAKQPVCPTHRFSSQSQRALHDTQENSLKSQNGDLAQKLKMKQGCTWEKNCSEMIQDVT